MKISFSAAGISMTLRLPECRLHRLRSQNISVMSIPFRRLQMWMHHLFFISGGEEMNSIRNFRIHGQGVG